MLLAVAGLVQSLAKRKIDLFERRHEAREIRAGKRRQQAIRRSRVAIETGHGLVDARKTIGRLGNVMLARPHSYDRIVNQVLSRRGPSVRNRTSLDEPPIGAQTAPLTALIVLREKKK